MSLSCKTIGADTATSSCSRSVSRLNKTLGEQVVQQRQQVALAALRFHPYFTNMSHLLLAPKGHNSL